MNQWSRGDHHLRLSDAERERAAAELAEHYAQGRLSLEEHGERLDAIWSARTRGELPPLFADLPSLAPAGVAARRPAPSRRRFRGVPLPLAVLLVVLVAVTVLSHLPLLLVLGLAWLLLSRGAPCSPRRHRYR